MTKKFRDFKSAFDWGRKLIQTGTEKALETVTEQIYKDSNEFTYRETGDMYKSGAIYSDFDKGLIVERTPYVRRRYYEGGKAGAKNKNAQPRWFEKTFSKHKKDYQIQITKAIGKTKKEI